jgi:hypothetical protein
MNNLNTFTLYLLRLKVAMVYRLMVLGTRQVSLKILSGLKVLRTKRVLRFQGQFETDGDIAADSFSTLKDEILPEN